MKLDKIKIEDLEVFANHGVFPEENTLGAEICGVCGYVYGYQTGRIDR